jgi:GNAT superfamily N-acetyltransferase
MILRDADIKDSEAIRAILIPCYRRFAVTDAWPQQITVECAESLASSAAIRNTLETGKVHLAETEAACIGMVSLMDQEITSLFVHPDRQRGGIGAALFRRAIGEIRNQGHRHATVCVVAASAIGFYERMGMRVTETGAVTHGPCKGMPVSRLTYAMR